MVHGCFRIRVLVLDINREFIGNTLPGVHEVLDVIYQPRSNQLHFMWGLFILNIYNWNVIIYFTAKVLTRCLHRTCCKNTHWPKQSTWFPVNNIVKRAVSFAKKFWVSFFILRIWIGIFAEKEYSEMSPVAGRYMLVFHCSLKPLEGIQHKITLFLLFPITILLRVHIGITFHVVIKYRSLHR